VKLTAKGRYAVMAVADLAAQGPAACESLSAVGMRQSISVTFLEQLFGKLRRAGLVESVRGAQGGYSLSRPATAISLDAIIRAVDASAKAHGCTPDAKLACTGGTDRCLTHDLWGALEDHIEGFLSSITVQDVVDGRLPLVSTGLDLGKLEAAE
jgi:Rrf2 family iron-sulfur cluster assembly transcriptional regulator